MCLENEIDVDPEKAKSQIGYVVAIKHNNNYLSFFYPTHSYPYKKGVKYQAQPKQEGGSYYGFHGFYTIKDVEKYFGRSTIKGDDIALLKCKSEKLIKEGDAVYFLKPIKSFRAKYRTILEEVKIGEMA